MNLKSVLCAATMLAAAGVAQAFPDYTLYPKDGSEFNSAQNLANFNLTFTGVDVQVADAAYAMLESDQGDEAESTTFENFMNSGTIIINFDSKEIVANGQWTLTIPAGSMTVDGEESPEITAIYTLNDPNLGLGEFPQIDLVSIEPAAGSKLANWGGEDFTRVNLKTTDDAAVNYIEWTLYDVTDGYDKYVRQGNDNRYDFNRYLHHDDIWADGLFIAVSGDDKLILGHTYRLDLRFCGIGYNDATNQYPTPQQIQISTELQTSVTYEGLTPPQEYAKAEYESIDPDPETYDIVDPNQAFFHVTYTAPAKPVQFIYALGFGMGTAPAGTWAPFEGMVEDENGLCTKWTFTFDPSVVAVGTGTIFTSIQSMDADGLYVRGNAEDMDFDDINYSITWYCNCGAPDLVAVDPIAGSTLKSFSSITISNEKDGKTLPMNYSYATSEKIRIVNRQGGEIRVLENSDALEYTEDRLQATWNFEPITENGVYVVIIPKHFFSIGEEYEGSSSNLTTFEYIVDNGETPSNVKYDITPVTVNPESGTNVESIKDIVLTFSDLTLTPMNGSAQNIQLFVKNGPGATLLQTIDPYNKNELEYNDYFNPTVYTLHFSEIVEDGEYEVVIPQGVFCDESYDENDGDSGHANAEIVLNYTIGQQTPSDVVYDLLPSVITPLDNSTVNEISDVYLEFENTTFMVFSGDAWMPKQTAIYRLNGEEKELVEEVYCLDDGDNPNYNFLTPKYYVFRFSPIEEKGQYVIEVEEGTFCDETADIEFYKAGRMNPAFNIYYTVGDNVGVDAIFGSDALINVYDVNGVQVLKNANVEAAKELKSGLYIINGKKVMIRR